MTLPDDVVQILREFSAATSHLLARELDMHLGHEVRRLGHPFFQQLTRKGFSRVRAARLLGDAIADDRKAWRDRKLVA